MTFTPVIDPAIFRIAPGFRAISLVVQCGPARPHAVEVARLAMAEAVSMVQTSGPGWAAAHLEAWRDVYRRFGAKPQRTPGSAEALRERVLRSGSLPPIDPAVDLYNAISLRFAIPVGGESVAAYHGMPRLVVADGGEPFDTVKNGQPAKEPVEAGEIIWRDDIGVTCRRWNWRQGVRTRLESSQGYFWFILESLPAMPFGEVAVACDALQTGLKEMFGDADCQRLIIGEGE